MQWCGSTNKSSTKLNAAEIKFNMVLCLRMGKTTKAKTPWVNLRSQFPRIHYYQSQVEEILSNPLTYLKIPMMNGSQYVTNTIATL